MTKLYPFLLLIFAAGCDDNLTVVEREDYEPPGVDPLACVPNLDGRIEASEIMAAIGVPIRYLVSPAGAMREVDIAGQDDGDGLAWDLSIDYADDQQVVVVPTLAKDRWYGASFPPDAIVTPFDAGGRIESIAQLDDQALWVLGLASAEENPAEGQTLVVYDAPVAALRFPIEPGVSFTSTGTVVGGVILGLPYAGVDTYEVAIDATGQLDLPQLSFTQAHRVRQRVTITPAVGAATSQRRVSWFFECFAEVARATSQPDEPDENFTGAAEVWRLGIQ